MPHQQHTTPLADTNPVSTFREQYRHRISSWYAPRLHVGFVLGAGMMFIAVCGFLSAKAPSGWWGFGVLAGLLAMNVAHYWVHQKLGHRKHAFAIFRLFYQRHTGDHHHFFTDEHYAIDDLIDCRVVLFPPWLLVVIGLIATLLAMVINTVWPPLGWAFATGWMLGYLWYEWVHLLCHLPRQSFPILNLCLPAFLREHHRLHHRRDLAQHHNFNVTFPIADWLFGTRYKGE